jgi:uncharacterized protein (TIGR02266 family)
VPRKEHSPVSIRIRLKYPDLDTFIEKYAANISQGGMFIQSRAPQPVGTTLRFEVLLADGSRLLKGEGKVIWVREYDAGQPTKVHGMGVKFLELDDESQSVVSLVLAHKGGRLERKKKSATQEVQALEGEARTDEEEPEEQSDAERRGAEEPAAEPADEALLEEAPPKAPEEQPTAGVPEMFAPKPAARAERPPDRVDVAMAVVDAGGDGVAVALANADQALAALMDEAGISDAQVGATISRALSQGGEGSAGVDGLEQLLAHEPPPPVDAQAAMEALNQTLGASVVVPPPRWEKPPPLVAPAPEVEPEPAPVERQAEPAAEEPAPEPDDEPITLPVRDELEEPEPGYEGEPAPDDLPLFEVEASAHEQPDYEQPDYEQPEHEQPEYQHEQAGYDDTVPFAKEDEPPIVELPSLEEDEIESAEPPDEADLSEVYSSAPDLEIPSAPQVEPPPDPGFDPRLLEAAASVSRAHDPEHAQQDFDLSEESTLGIDDEVFADTVSSEEQPQARRVDTDLDGEPRPPYPDAGWQGLKTATKLLDHETSDVLQDLAQRSSPEQDDGYHEPLGDFSADEIEDAVTGLRLEGDEADQLSNEMWQEVQREAADLSDPGSVPVSMADDPGAEPVARIESEEHVSINLDDFSDDSQFEVEEETQVSGAPSFDDEVSADPAADLLPADNIFPPDPDLHDEVFDALAGLKNAEQEHVPADAALDAPLDVLVEPSKPTTSDVSVPSLDDLATVAQSSPSPQEPPSHPVDLDDIQVIADDPEQEAEPGQEFKPRKSGIFRRLFGKKKE